MLKLSNNMMIATTVWNHDSFTPHKAAAQFRNKAYLYITDVFYSVALL